MHYKTKVEFVLEPVGTPEVFIVVGQQLLNRVITKTERIIFDLEVPAVTIPLRVSLLNKSDNDPTTAVIIQELCINGISDPKFVWAGTYYPDYPKVWAKQQRDLDLAITNTNYLGWNGTWNLDITIPAFTWMHQTLNLGWIYK